MKKFLALVILFTFLLSANTFADEGFAIGVAATFGITNFLEGGAAGTPGVIGLLMIPGIPVMFGFGGTLGQTTTNFLIKADWWLASGPIAGMLSYYVGPGVYLIIAQTFDVGLRIPVGLRIFPIDFLEIFLEPALTVGIGNIGGDPMQFPTVGFQGELGVRFWF